jgi:hypothetical protein
MLTDVTQAVADQITAAGYPARREYVPEEELKTLTATVYTVVPASEEATPADRGRDRLEYEIHVGILAKLTQTGDAAKAETDALMATVYAIRDALNPRNFPTAAGARVLAPVKIAPLYSVKHLREHRVFLAVVKLRAAELRGAAG